MKTLVKGFFMMFLMAFTYLDVMSCRPIYNNIKSISMVVLHFV